MKNRGAHVSVHGLDMHGIETNGRVYWNLPTARLYEESLRRGEAELAAELKRERAAVELDLGLQGGEGE